MIWRVIAASSWLSVFAVSTAVVLLASLAGCGTRDQWRCGLAGMGNPLAGQMCAQSVRAAEAEAREAARRDRQEYMQCLELGVHYPELDLGCEALPGARRDNAPH